MEKLLGSLPGVIIIMDDILVYGTAQGEHDERLQTVLETIKSSGLKLNKAKCMFSQRELTFTGNIVSKDWVKPDPEKVSAIYQFPAPENITGLQRVIGMANYLGRFISDLSTVIKAMTDLVKSDVVWQWGTAQEKAFQLLKERVSTTPVLVFYDPNRATVVSAGASNFGLGAVLLQQHDGAMKPVVYSSKTLTSAETRYAQIEKELLACTWACEKFSRYMVGLESFKVLTDHKPLITVINTQDLDRAPLRCQRLLMRLMEFNGTAVHIPGRDMVLADALSRSPLFNQGTPDIELEIASYADAVMEMKPVSSRRLVKIAVETSQDPQLQTAMKFVRHGWPDYIKAVPPMVQDLYRVRAEMSIAGDLLVRDSRIVMPQALHMETLEKLHEGHLGVYKCKERAKTAVWWPGLTKDIEGIAVNCIFCQRQKPTQWKEPLMPSPMSGRPWQRIGTDFCEQDGKHYLIVVDYYLRYLEITNLSNTTSSYVIGKLRNMFARWGIPYELVTDNGTQFCSEEFQSFVSVYGFTHTTSSPHFPQSNGEAERAVQTAKKILRQDYIFLALMAYQSTPVVPTGESPSKLLMGRQINTRLPTVEKNLKPQWPDLAKVRVTDQKAKAANCYYYNRLHGARSLPVPQPGDAVRVKLHGEKEWRQTGLITTPHDTSRSYVVQTPDGRYRRNRKHLQVLPSAGERHNDK